MSFSFCIGSGATTGWIAGTAAGAYFVVAGVCAEKKDNPAAVRLAMSGIGSFIGGPIVGAGFGGSYYGIKRSFKYLHTAPRSIQMSVLTIAGLGISIPVAYKLGK